MIIGVLMLGLMATTVIVAIPNIVTNDEIFAPIRHLVPTNTPTPTPIPTPLPTLVDKKAKAEKAFSAFTRMQNSLFSIMITCKDVISGLADSSLSSYRAYEILDDAGMKLVSVTSNIKSMEVSQRYKNEKGYLVDACSNLESTLKDIKDYIDNNKVSSAVNAKNHIQMTVYEYKMVIDLVRKKVIEDGYDPEQASVQPRVK